MLPADKVSTTHMSLSKSSFIFLTNHTEIQLASHAQHSFCMLYWIFVETTASKPLFLMVFFSCCSTFTVPTSFTYRAFPSNYDLCCSVSQHFLSNCGILPYLISNSQFLPWSVTTGMLASHPALHLTAKPLTHLSRRMLFPDPALSLGYKQPLVRASLTPPLTFTSALQHKALLLWV